MNKMITSTFLVLVLAGCTYKGQDPNTYLDNPQTIIQDPHFTRYKEERDDLEHRYLQKAITFAEYTEKMKELDDKYSKEVQERDAIISPMDQ